MVLTAPGEARQVHINRFEVIPKKQSDKWRPILDLSHPEGKSINDGVSPSLCSLHYARVDEAAGIIRERDPACEARHQKCIPHSATPLR